MEQKTFSSSRPNILCWSACPDFIIVLTYFLWLVLVINKNVIVWRQIILIAIGWPTSEQLTHLKTMCRYSLPFDSISAEKRYVLASVKRDQRYYCCPQHYAKTRCYRLYLQGISDKINLEKEQLQKFTDTWGKNFAYMLHRTRILFQRIFFSDSNMRCWLEKWIDLSQKSCQPQQL